ncbi:hypothetical protein CI102_11040 [Trichoderma harzianum]|nr:hypothetical protein CI102_11040 [Trichoderma harzianum]
MEEISFLVIASTATAESLCNLCVACWTTAIFTKYVLSHTLKIQPHKAKTSRKKRDFVSRRFVRHVNNRGEAGPRTSFWFFFVPPWLHDKQSKQ